MVLAGGCLDQSGPSVASRGLSPANHSPAPPDSLTLYGSEVYFISTGRATLWTLRPCQHFNNTRSMHRELFLRFFNKADISEWALRCGQRPKTSWHHRNSAWASLLDHAMTMTTHWPMQHNAMRSRTQPSAAGPEQLHYAVPYHHWTWPLAPSRGQCAYCPAPPISSGPGAVSVYTSYWGVVCRYQAPASV